MNFKITDKNGQTFGGCQWGEGVRNTAIGEGNELCSGGVIHYYADPLLAAFVNPIHGDYDPKTMILWEFAPDSEVTGDALKRACKSGMTVRQIPIPEITTEQRVEVGIRAAKLVCKDKEWGKWADKWLSGEDRTEATAGAARGAAGATSAAWAAAWAAEAAFSAARAAAEAAVWAAEIDILPIIKQVVAPQGEK